MIHTFLIQWWTYKSTNKIFNVHKYSAYEVKASLFPVSLAPLPVGSCVVTSTETGKREHLEQMEAYQQGHKRNVRLFLLCVSQLLGLVCGQPSSPAHLAVEHQLCCVQRGLVYSVLGLELCRLHCKGRFYRINWKERGLKGRTSYRQSVCIPHLKTDVSGKTTTSKCSWSESKCNDLQF